MIYILQKVNFAQGELYKLTSKAWKRYAERHSYGYIFDTNSYNDYINGMWMKWVAVENAFKLINKNDWLFWCDADTLPMNPHIDVSTILDKDLVISTWVSPTHIRIYDIGKDIKAEYCSWETLGWWNTVHTGNFLIRNCEWSRNLVYEMQRDERIFKNPILMKHPQGDEVGMVVYILGNADNRAHVKFMPVEFFFTKPSFGCPVSALSTIKRYQKGDFIVHAAGYPLSEKIEVLSRYAQQIEW